MTVAMIYLKSILAGVAAFVVTTIIASAAAIAFMVRHEPLARRMFPAQHFDIQIGSRYYINFPLWHVAILGVVAFAITFAWFVKRASART
jgi:hypothetical protein